jgi:hypothetical protein
MNATVTETLPSRLLPDILERVADPSPLMVLDVGMGVHETVEYFGQKRCRLHFSCFHDALVAAPVVTSQPKIGHIVDEAERQEQLLDAWRKTFSAMMDYRKGTSFDVCLFWDFFNYLDDLALKAFSDALSPYIGPHTRAHALVLLKPDTNVLNREYGIMAHDQIAMRPGNLGRLDSYPRPQARLASLLKDFSVSHSVLRRDGLLEVSLKSN